MAYLTLKEINEKDIVDFLSALGYQPRKISGKSWWYLSMLPGRSEKTPSFKVNRTTNRWIDFGYDSKEHGLVDLGILLFNCTIRELVIRLSGPGASLSPVIRTDPFPEADDHPKLAVVRTSPLRSEYLIRYLWERRIPNSVAQRFCVEAQYTFDQKKFYHAVAFPSDAGGWNLRNKYHKYSSSPKSPTLICNGSKKVAVFEGFFNMMTLVSILSCSDQELPDLLVLNGAGFFTEYLALIDSYDKKYLFLDNDATGNTLTAAGLSKGGSYFDQRPLYHGYKDLNEWACSIGMPRPVHRLNLMPAIAGTGP